MQCYPTSESANNSVESINYPADNLLAHFKRYVKGTKNMKFQYTDNFTSKYRYGKLYPKGIAEQYFNDFNLNVINLKCFDRIQDLFMLKK